MAIGKGSRVEFKGPDGLMFGLVFKTRGSEAQVLSDSGATFRGDLRSLKESTQPLPSEHPSKKFVKGARIEFESKSFAGRKPGVVAKIDMFGFMEVVADEGAVWKEVLATKAHPSKLPLPAHMSKGAVAHAKGARVEFMHKDEMLYGVVTKAGTRTQVMQDGGVVLHSGSAAAFRPSTHPLKVGGPDDMDCWSVASYKLHERMSEETPCFEAVIVLDGRKVIAASNRGTGGSDEFHALPGAPNRVLDRFEAEAKAWAKRFDDKADDHKYSEDASSWLDWEVNKKPYGVPAKDYFDDRNRSFEEMMSQPFKLR
jgi:hypothetical protein